MGNVSFYKDGKPVSAEALLRMEVRRARSMMAMLMRKLDAGAIAELFADEIAASARDQLEWNRQDRYAESVTTARVAEGNAAEFIEWYVTGYLGANRAAMQRAHPEHLGMMLLPGGRIGILEMTGHGHGPDLLRAVRLEDAIGLPIAVDPEMPFRMLLRSESADGQTLGYVLHQFRDTQPGFEARLAVYWPVGAPAPMVQGHVDHLMIEFSNWFGMYLQARKQPDDLMPLALSVNT